MKKSINNLLTLLVTFHFLMAIDCATANETQEIDYCVEAEKIATQKQGAFEALIELYFTSTSWKAWKCIPRHLVQIDENKAVDLFIQSLNSNAPDIKKKAIIGLGLIKNKKAADPLFEIYQNSDDDQIKCRAAGSLGSINDPRALPLFRQDLENQNPSIRNCTITALRQYKDPQDCQKFYELWINDSDDFVRGRAAMALILGNCRDKIKRREIEGIDSDVDSKCCQEAQKHIELIEQYPTKRELKQNFDPKKFQTDIDCTGKGEAPITSWVALNLIFDWHESVSKFENAEDWGSLEENKRHYLGEIMTCWEKEERAITICPNLKFPDFELWNQLIQRGLK